ncbi:MAG: flagellar hook-length control protein FliK [Alphaproteobacteria bacterium]|nr:flagellar hook-length control protein FliK [Alphaproteobacteria bacterium]
MSTDSLATTGTRVGRQDRATAPDETRGESFKLQLAALGKESPETDQANPEQVPSEDPAETTCLKRSLMEASQDTEGNLQTSEDASQPLSASEETDIDIVDTDDEIINATYPLSLDTPASQAESAHPAEVSSMQDESDMEVLAEQSAPEAKPSTSVQTNKVENPSEEELDQAEVQLPLANPTAAQMANIKDTASSRDVTGQVAGTDKIVASAPDATTVARANTAQGTLASVDTQMSSDSQTAAPSTEAFASPGELAEEAVSEPGTDTLQAGSQKKTPDSPVQLAAAVTPSPTSAQAPAPAAATQAAQPHLVSAGAYIAAPADIPTIISQELSSDNKHDKISVQLDPPELGRISIEFKFDSQGLQHVLVTADSADAIRRIRAFHQDLVSVLEQNGLTSQDMTFREQSSGQNPSRSWADHSMQTQVDTGIPAAEPDIRVSSKTPTHILSTGLDVRL